MLNKLIFVLHILSGRAHFECFILLYSIKLYKSYHRLVVLSCEDTIYLK